MPSTSGPENKRPANHPPAICKPSFSLQQSCIFFAVAAGSSLIKTIPIDPSTRSRNWPIWVLLKARRKILFLTTLYPEPISERDVLKPSAF